jgi:molybdopterin-guanine dinucleotide biosynthesis protein A
MDGPAERSESSGIVLAGGRSRRLGRNKALESFGGQPLILRVIDRVSQVAEDVVVVVADQAQADALPLENQHRVVVDLHPGGGSLGGIFSGLSAARNQWAMVVACDMPFLNLDLVRRMLVLREGADAVVPVLGGRPEPTHAIYSKVCLPFMEQLLLANDLKISLFFDKVRVAYLPEEEVLSLDPDCLSFFNVNNPDDLERALTLAAEGR